jgi:hypothetical protein
VGSPIILASSRGFYRVRWDTEFFGLLVNTSLFFAYRLLTIFVHDDFKFTGYLPGLFVSGVI